MSDDKLNTYREAHASDTSLQVLIRYTKEVVALKGENTIQHPIL